MGQKSQKYGNVANIKAVAQIGEGKERMVMAHYTVIEKKAKLDWFLRPKPRINSNLVKGLKLKSKTT